MAVVRKNILSDNTVRDKFTQGVMLLKREQTQFTTQGLHISGPNQQLSTYDLFVVWHNRAMMTLTPATNNPLQRNSAHRGPIFAPWHRVMLMLMEQNLQRVLSDPAFGLPYWDWAADGALSPDQQAEAPLWNANCLGGSGAPIVTGPFAFNASDPNSFRVRVAGTSTGSMRSINRGLQRGLGADIDTLPRNSEVTDALAQNQYDAPGWDVQTQGFRNRLEGWLNASNPNEPGLHNRVHVFIGGDMSPGTSPNDPVFYLNHCNVDRNWEAWLQKHGRTYVPDSTAGAALAGQRIDDPIVSPLGSGASPRQVLDVGSVYTYDVLPA